MKRKNGQDSMAQRKEQGDEAPEMSKNEKKKKKRKGKVADDLRLRHWIHQLLVHLEKSAKRSKLYNLCPHTYLHEG